MELMSLKLNNFRNYESLDVSFSSGVNVFLGPNAQGKTNLLEAIYVLALTRSHRTSTDKELISWQAKEAQVAGTVARQYSDVPLSLKFTNKGKKARINHLDQAKLANYIGQLNVILFAPEDLSLVKGSPQIRRKFLDMELGQINPIYLYDLVQYQGILKQRNQYLKQLNEKKQTDLLYLDILSEQLAEFGSKVLKARAQFVRRLEFWANTLHQQITHQKEQLEIEYVTSFSSLSTQTQEEIQTQFLELLNQNKKKDMFRGTTTIGPHRDDLSFFVNQKNVQTYGSQGQQRTTALSVKLAEIDLIKEETGEYPILLLDDVMSELDDNRQLHLLETIEGKVQTFLTTTTLDHVKNKMTVEPEIFYVQQGEIKGEEG